jgi:hypothetical protein
LKTQKQREEYFKIKKYLESWNYFQKQKITLREICYELGVEYVG